MNILVSGGAGYIGSHVVRLLQEANHSVTVLDNLEKGHTKACKGAELVAGDSGDATLVGEIIHKKAIDCVMHFAAYIEVGESMSDPAKYFMNNTGTSARLVRACIDNGVKRFIFSSTCAIYGQPERMPLVESMPRNPLSAYGKAKLQTEEMLEWVSNLTDFRYVALRYFNASGAHPSGEIGEDHSPETHLIPLVLQVAQGKRKEIKIFGTDYPTPDGTCVRDYIHVCDLARGHIAAMDYLMKGGVSAAFNIGTGEGYSVRQVIEACRKETGHPIPAVENPRRPGDPPALYADPAAIRNVLGWKPVESDLGNIVKSAWQWHKGHPEGYRS